MRNRNNDALGGDAVFFTFLSAEVHRLYPPVQVWSFTLSLFFPGWKMRHLLTFSINKNSNFTNLYSKKKRKKIKEDIQLYRNGCVDIQKAFSLFESIGPIISAMLYLIPTPAEEVMFSFVSVCLTAGLLEMLWTHLHETWWASWVRSTEEPFKF